MTEPAKPGNEYVTWFFTVPLENGKSVTAEAWLNRDGNIEAMVENSVYIGSSWYEVQEFIRLDPKRNHK